MTAGSFPIASDASTTHRPFKSTPLERILTKVVTCKEALGARQLGIEVV